MEPVFMVLAQSAAAAAVQAINENASVQKINYSNLLSQLSKDNQVLTWENESVLASEKEIELQNENSKNVMVRSVKFKDVALVPYSGNFKEYNSKGGSN